MAGAYLSGHGTSVPMNLTLLFGTEVPCFENNKLGVHEQNNREPFDYSCTVLINLDVYYLSPNAVFL